MERETGIEPATNSLEGCDSTTELLPPSRLAVGPLTASASRPANRLPRLTFYRSCRLGRSAPAAPREARLAPNTQSHQTEKPSRGQGPRGLVGRGGFEPP